MTCCYECWVLFLGKALCHLTCLQKKRVHTYGTYFNDQVYVCSSSENFSSVLSVLINVLAVKKVSHTTARSNFMWKCHLSNIDPIASSLVIQHQTFLCVFITQMEAQGLYTDFHTIRRYPELVPSILLEPVDLPNRKETGFKISIKALVFLSLLFLPIYLKYLLFFSWTFPSYSVLLFSLPL